MTQRTNSLPVRAVVIVPTYNEIENLPPLVEQLLGLRASLGVIVVDDNSPDGTGQLADQLAAKHPEVEVIHRPGKLGLGTAYRAGFARALERGAPLVLTMDADFSHHPRYIPAMLGRAADCHLVIGSRYIGGGGAVGCTLPRIALSRGANLFAKVLLGLRASDCTAGFRCYQRVVLQTIGPDTVLSEGYSFLIEMLYRVQQAGFQTGEVPILFANRQHGASKISRREVARAVATVLRLWSGRSPQRRER
ncbi:MAG TPA: polyprenol monophosphomannose synthase [Anaerolineae bacterium]|nr:polyprenol monophosphomannose synthase [Anaerolineae bacterium]HOQ98496.1 polyprenol monophosphomannose synthase [Anaerolineae bacterium]HPL30232.1 polyprenol monophosphomannose synthase [Anaerolineae bacterium]